MLFLDRLGYEDLVAWADGTYHKPDAPQSDFHSDFPGRVVSIVTTDWLKEHGADIVISTVSGTRQPMKALAKELGALYVDHVGNVWDAPIGDVVLRSVAGSYGLEYHPEFHRVPWTPPQGRRVGSFHSNFAVMDCKRDWDRLKTPEWELYGVPENPLYPWEVAPARAACAAIWHCKDTDGYGFAVHEAFAAGRPIIGHARHYEGKFAEPLFIHGVTYLEPDDDIFRAIEHPVDMGLNARERFDALVDFATEADAIRSYLEVLLR